MAQDTSTSPDGVLDATFYFLRDAQYNVTALADAAGAVVERYEYGAFGAPTILNAAGEKIESSGYGNALLFTGREYDAETGLYYYRMRMYDPKLGRFISSEPYGDWYDPNNLGNGYAYVGNSPWLGLDPMGLGKFRVRKPEPPFPGYSSPSGAFVDSLIEDIAPIACEIFISEVYPPSDYIFAVRDWQNGDKLSACFGFLPIVGAISKAGKHAGGFPPLHLGPDVGGVPGGGGPKPPKPIVNDPPPRPSINPNPGDGPWVFRGDDNVSPGDAVNSGIQPHGDSTDLWSHANDSDNPPSNYVSTSPNPDVALQYGDNVYVIRPEGGIDVNETLGNSSPYPIESEIAIPGGIEPYNIRGVTDWLNQITYLNPNWKP